MIAIALLAASLLAGTPAPSAEPRCADPPSDRPPDPRCGEPLDGRGATDPAPALTAPRLLLSVPRLASRAAFWPILGAGELIETYHVGGWMDVILTTDDGLVGVRPEIRYASSFLPTAGARFFHRRLPVPGSSLQLRFLTGGPSALLGEVALTAPEAVGLELHATWSRRADRLFAGIGPNSRADLQSQGRDLARYRSDIWIGGLRWSRPLPFRTVAALHGDLHRRDYDAADVRGGTSVASVYGLPPAACAEAGLAPGCVDPAVLPGFASGTRIAHAGAGLALDLRDRARDGSGLSLAVDGTYAAGVAGDPSRHLTLSGEAVLGWGGSDRVILLRARAAMVEALGRAPIPFDELVSPAGMTGMRGFPDGRFRDASGLVATVEYRWFIAYNLDAALFCDLGTVAGPRFSGLRGDRLFPTYGLGIRRTAPAAQYWRAPTTDGLQLAYAPDQGFRLLLAFAAF